MAARSSTTLNEDLKNSQQQACSHTQHFEHKIKYQLNPKKHHCPQLSSTPKISFIQDQQLVWDDGGENAATQLLKIVNAQVNNLRYLASSVRALLAHHAISFPGFIKKTPPADSTATEDLRKTELLSCDLLVQSKSLGVSSNALVVQKRDSIFR